MGIRNPMYSVQDEEQPKEVANKRLPRITQRNVSPTASVQCDIGSDSHRTATRRNVPGSRLFATRFGRSSLFERIRWVPEPHAKAAPLQSNSLNS